MPRGCWDCLHLSSMEHNQSQVGGGRVDRSIIKMSIVEGRICSEDLCVGCPDCVLYCLRNVRKCSYVMILIWAYTNSLLRDFPDKFFRGKKPLMTETWNLVIGKRTFVRRRALLMLQFLFML